MYPLTITCINVICSLLSKQINSNCNYLAFAAADLYNFDDEKVVALSLNFIQEIGIVIVLWSKLIFE